MGFVKKVFKSVFGGNDDVSVPTPAQPAAPEGETATQESTTNNSVKKRKRGKNALLVDSNSTSSTGSTGLNI